MMDCEWIVKLQERIFNKVLSIQTMWNEIGIEACRIEQRKDSLSSHLLKMLDEMFDEDLLSKQALLRSIEDLKLKIRTLSTELGLKEFSLKHGPTILITEKNHYDQFKYLSDLVAKKLETFQQLKHEEESLSARLGEESIIVVYQHVPSPKQFELVETNLVRLTREKDLRSQRLNTYRANILGMYDIIGAEWLPSNTLMKQILSVSTADKLSLNLEFLENVKNLMHECENQVTKVEKECCSLMETLRLLTRRLNMDLESRLDINQQYSVYFLKELKFQEETLKKFRDTNISGYIGNCCQDLRSWWTKCFVCGADRNEALVEKCLLLGQTGTSAVSSEQIEVLLNDIELEILKWSTYYAEHQALFENLSTWQKLFDELKELEVKRVDPVTLKNRGGILLTIQRQHNHTHRELRRCEALLSNLSSEVGQKEVRVNGVTVSDYIQDVYLKHEEENQAKSRMKNNSNNTKSLNSTRCPLSYSARRPSEKRKYTPLQQRNDSIATTSSCYTAPTRAKKSRADWSLSTVSSVPGVRTYAQPASNPFLDFLDEYSARNGPLTSSPILRVALVDCCDEQKQGHCLKNQPVSHQVNTPSCLTSKQNLLNTRKATQPSPATVSRLAYSRTPKTTPTKTPVRHFRTPTGCPPNSARKTKQMTTRRSRVYSIACDL